MNGFDGNKRWGNSALAGHGVNSPAMMAARKQFEAQHCTYPDCKCIVSTSTSNPEPKCPLGLLPPD